MHSGHPINPFRLLLQPGLHPLDASRAADEGEPPDKTPRLLGWAAPGALVTAVAVLGDVCPPAWPPAAPAPGKRPPEVRC